jgi:hypothetical protein
VKLIEAIPDLTNFFILMDNGQLGSYTPKGEFILHKESTAAFAEVIEQLLTQYKADPESPGYRLGIVYPTHEERPWKSASFAVEQHMLRKLYPSGGTQGAELTSFQKRNIEKSIYQGVELLMEHHDEALPGVQIYCPVLYFRKKTLADYLSTVSRPEHPQDKTTPVMDVLNLFAPLPVSRRSNKEIVAVTRKIYEGVIHKGSRKNAYGFLSQKGKSGVISQPVADDMSAQVDRALADIFGDRSGQEFSSLMQAYCEPETYERVGKWLENPYQYVKPEQLKSYSRFRGLSMDGLVILADQHPIFRAPVTTQLLARGTKDNWNMYLLDGALELEADDGEKLIVEAQTPRAAAPISSLKPRIFTVTAATPVKFLWMFDPFVETLIKIDKENRDEDELTVQSLREP